MFDQLHLATDDQVLEYGGGPGWLWRSNIVRLPAGCHLTLMELPPGMVAEAHAAHSKSGRSLS